MEATLLGFPAKLSFQEHLTYQARGMDSSASPRPQWAVGGGGIRLIPSFAFCKNICTEAFVPDPQSATDRSPGFLLPCFTG